jgi:hypothetical protein
MRRAARPYVDDIKPVLEPTTTRAHEFYYAVAALDD